jgi:hypothetical protein
MNLDVLTQIPLSDYAIVLIAVVLVIWAALKREISVSTDSPTHQFLDDLQFGITYESVSGNVHHNDDD